MSIKHKVDMLCRKCDTRDPFTIAAKLGIRVLHEPLGSIRGYYSRTHRIKFIHINQDLSKERQRQVCAHELGHAILHPKSNTPFLRANTLYSVNKLETEYSCAVTPQVRQTGNRLSGLAGTAYASLLT